MVKSGKFGLEVLVGGVPLPELVTESGVTYVETRFDSPVTYKVTSKDKDPFGEVYEQQWPVTPYTLRISNRSGDKVHATVYVDGSVACKQFVDDVAEIKGYRATYLVCVDAQQRRRAAAATRRATATHNALTRVFRRAAQRRPVQGVHLHGAAPAAQAREHGRRGHADGRGKGAPRPWLPRAARACCPTAPDCAPRTGRRCARAHVKRAAPPSPGLPQLWA